MTDHAFVNGGLGLCADCGCTESAPRHNLQPPSELDRATQALKDMAVHMAVVKARAAAVDDLNEIGRAAFECVEAKVRLVRAAEDYAEAYLRG